MTRPFLVDPALVTVIFADATPDFVIDTAESNFAVSMAPRSFLHMQISQQNRDHV